MEDGTANVPWIQEKLSGEAFSGARIRLLNAKNIPIADTEGTRGVYILLTIAQPYIHDRIKVLCICHLHYCVSYKVISRGGGLHGIYIPRAEGLEVCKSCGDRHRVV